MADRQAAIFAVYPTHESAEKALNALRARGFANSDISVVAPRGDEPVQTPADSGSAMPELSPGESGPVPALGLALGWLVNIGAIAVSGAMLVAAGPILATLRGVSDALLGLADSLVGFGVPADEAKKYEDRVRGGAILLSVHGADAGWIAKGKEIFEQTGAEDISPWQGGAAVDAALAR